MLGFLEKKVFGGCKSQILFIGDQNAGLGDRMAEARRHSKRHGGGFAGPGGILQIWRVEARRSFLWGRLLAPMNPFLPGLFFILKLFVNKSLKLDHYSNCSFS